MRALVVSLGSLFLTAAVLGNAYYQKKQFYPSVVYITKSNPSMAVIYIQAFICVILVGKIMRKLFFGQLRAAEFEHLMERSWYAVTETCLAFTVFRDDFSPKFVALFTILLFLKSFHWLAEDRVDFMERSPVISWIFHLRVISLLILLGALDAHFVSHAYTSTITKGASVQLVFGFEYAILLTIIVNIAIKYVLHTIDLQSENPWENKAVYLLYTELVMGFNKVLLYLIFVAIMIRIYTLPLFAFRPMYLTMRAFKKAFNDVILSRRAIHNMNTLYPDATPEELTSADNVCIICRDEMVTASKKLPCNHIFHASCLRSWFQRQQTCPTCRLDVLQTTLPAQTTPTLHQQQQQQPQQQQPQTQAQNAAAANPFQQLAARGFAGPFPMWPPMQMPAAANAYPQGRAQTQGTSASSSAAASTSSPSSASGDFQQFGTSTSQQTGATTSSPSPPLFFPPFPFMPFTVPPPMPPANFSGMTAEELKAMEGNERANIEARIQCLRNIQTLLDAAVMQMQQYTTVVAGLNLNSSMSSSDSQQVRTETSPPQAAETPVTSALAAGVETPATGAPVASGETPIIDAPTDCEPVLTSESTSSVVRKHSETNNLNDCSLEGAVGYTPPEDVQEVVSQLENETADLQNSQNSVSDEIEAERGELRRRRLQKFGQQQEQQTTEGK